MRRIGMGGWAEPVVSGSPAQAARKVGAWIPGVCRWGAPARARASRGANGGTAVLPAPERAESTLA